MAASCAPVEVYERVLTLWPELLPFVQERAKRQALPLTFGASAGQAQIVVTTAPSISKEFLDARPKVTTIIVPAAGVGPNIKEALEATGRSDSIKVYNSHHNAKATGEMGLSLLFALSRRVFPADKRMRTNDWTYRSKIKTGQAGATLIYNGTALVLGYGNVGQHVARVLAATGMTVMTTRSSATEVSQDGAVQIFPAEQLAELLPRCTALVITLPLTSATRGMLGAKELALLRKECSIVNIGRAEVIDEDALWAELTSPEKQLGYAADVWWAEPKADAQSTAPSRHDFAGLDNVIMTPHIADGLGLAGMEEARADAVSKVLASVCAGDGSVRPVNPSAGY